MFSQTMEYALRVVAYLAGQGDHPVTTKQIAAATRIPEGYLAKVIRSLNRAGLVHSQRGLHGGSTLARAPDQVTVYDVVESVSPLPRIRTCPLGIHGAALCPLHRKLDDAVAAVEKAFRSTTMADLLNEPSHSKPLCGFADAEPLRKKGREPSPARLTISGKR